MHIGILGGTGPAGKGLAARLASVGFDVSVGSRSKDRAAEIVEGLVGQWPDHDLPISPADNAGAAAADVVVVATPWDGAVETVLPLTDQLAGKVVISMANALVRLAKEFQPLLPPRGSVATSLQAALPASNVSAALHHVPARELGDLSQPVECDVLVCADDPRALQVTCDIVDKVPDMRALNAGSLAMATPVESFTAVLLQLNVNYKTRAAVRFTGIPER